MFTYKKTNRYELGVHKEGKPVALISKELYPTVWGVDIFERDDISYKEFSRLKDAKDFTERACS